MSTPALESVVRCDPEVLGGTPVFAGTRVPIKNLRLEGFVEEVAVVSREDAAIGVQAETHSGSDVHALAAQVADEPRSRLVVERKHGESIAALNATSNWAKYLSAHAATIKAATRQHSAAISRRVMARFLRTRTTAACTDLISSMVAKVAIRSLVVRN
jgi:hypothetical protein